MKYYRALDHVLATVELARKGEFENAIKALAKAVKSPDVDKALAALDEMQNRAFEAASAKPKKNVGMSKALARLLANQVTASEQDDQDDDQDDQEQQEETSAEQDEQDDQEFDLGDDQDDQEQQEETSAEQDDDMGEIDIDLDDRDDDDEDEPAQATASARQARAERNKAKRA